MQGLAADGGLFMPDAWPQVDIEKIKTLDSFIDVAKCIVPLFTKSSFSYDEVLELLDDTWHDFSKENFATIHQLDDTKSILELFHGPTAAFKDFGLQLAAAFFNKSLLKQNKTAIVLGATSGDTGSAAIDACKRFDSIKSFILLPDGNMSEVQRRQMTTVDSPNVFTLRVNGTFDDCQDIVKQAFSERSFLKDDQFLLAVNSINWVRIIGQICYYFYASLKTNQLREPLNFSVPTGNFGNVFAGHAARNCGLNIPKLLVASNKNDILTQFFTSAQMKIEEVVPTLSPSMDIQISSNLERFIFELFERDGKKVKNLLEKFRTDGNVRVDSDIEAKFSNSWAAYSFDDEEVIKCISSESERSGVILDPHSAIAVLAARSHREKQIDPEIPIVSLATAHPAKFPKAVERALGKCPPLPDRLADLHERPEFFTRLPNNLEIVKDHVISCSRIDEK